MANIKEEIKALKEINIDDVKILGEGSLGIVYKLKNLSQLIAIKCIKKTRLLNELVDLEKEAFSCLGENFPSVIKYHSIQEMPMYLAQY